MENDMVCVEAFRFRYPSVVAFAEKFLGYVLSPTQEFVLKLVTNVPMDTFERNIANPFKDLSSAAFLTEAELLKALKLSGRITTTYTPGWDKAPSAFILQAGRQSSKSTLTHILGA